MAANFHLGPKEQLQLQQLQQIDFWQKQISSSHEVVVDEFTKGNERRPTMPDKWELTRNLVLHDWQSRCVDNWFGAGGRGVVKVVTGAGKTVLALAIIERLQQTTMPDLRVAIVVPTVVLLEQWFDEITKASNLPPSCIGFIGAGKSDSFKSSIRVLIAVLNSAAKKLPQDVQHAGISSKLLLIADECHRTGAPEMRRVFETERACSLGLSATPEREYDISDEAEEGWDNGNHPSEDHSFESSVIGQELGNVVFELTYADAIRQGILPPFRIVHYGLPLSELESQRYSRLSREISDLQSDLQTKSLRGLGLVRWCKSRASRGDRVAARYISLLGDRKRLLYRIDSRSRAVVEILRRQLSQRGRANAILFHESIEEVMRLFLTLRDLGFEVVVEHSRFPDSMRAKSIRLFREGTARIIVSARSLIEGFNVPSADVGIVVAASSSVRQRIQTLGRLLRRNKLENGQEKSAELFVLYAKETVDEFIYQRADWDHFVGAERNEYYHWDPERDPSPTLIGEPPRRPPVSEDQIAELELQAGDEFAGDLGQGAPFSLDTQGNIRDESGDPIQPHRELSQVLSRWPRGAGRFRVTPRKLLVFALENDNQGGWRGVYLGRLTSPPRAASADPVFDKETAASPGNAFPLSEVRGKTFHVLQRDRRLIARKERGKVTFVLPLEQIRDVEKRAATERIQRALRDAYGRGHRVNRIVVTLRGQVVYVFENRAYLLGSAPEGADGFQFEEASP